MPLEPDEDDRKAQPSARGLLWSLFIALLVAGVAVGSSLAYRLAP